MAKMSAPGARYRTAEEIALHIRSTTGSVRVATSQQKIPHIKVGRRVLYDVEEIDRWLAGMRVPAAK